MSKEVKDDKENSPEEAAGPNPWPHEERLIIIKIGDYNVHILIEEAKN
jgi:hypothetical protein